jgi:hypothetical protein
MEQKLALGKYPIFSKEIAKSSTKFSSAKDIISYFKEQIDAHPMVAYIGSFDHYGHTTSIGGQIPADMKDIQNIIFCFGPQVPNADIVAVRPRSIGVVELENSFIVNFMEAPGAMPNQTMMQWVAGLES